MMDNTKDKVINHLHKELDNIEAILNLKVGSELVDEEGNTYSITWNENLLHYLLIRNGKGVVKILVSLDSLMVGLLRDNFLGHNEWRVVK